MELIFLCVCVYVCVIPYCHSMIYPHQQGRRQLEIIFASELYHITFVIRAANANQFLPDSLEQVFKGLYLLWKAELMRDPPFFLSFCGNFVYAVVENFIIVHFLSIRTSVNLPRKNNVKANEKKVLSESP